MTALLRNCHIPLKFCTIYVIWYIISYTKNQVCSVCGTEFFLPSHMSDTGHMRMQIYNHKVNIYMYIGLVLEQNMFCISFMPMYLVAWFILGDRKRHIYVTLSIKEPKFIITYYSYLFLKKSWNCLLILSNLCLLTCSFYKEITVF